MCRFIRHLLSTVLLPIFFCACAPSLQYQINENPQAEGNLVDNPKYAGAVVTMVRNIANMAEHNPEKAFAMINKFDSARKTSGDMQFWIYDLQLKLVAPAMNLGTEKNEFLQQPPHTVREQIRGNALSDSEGWVEYATHESSSTGNPIMRKCYFRHTITVNGGNYLICGSYSIK